MRAGQVAGILCIILAVVAAGYALRLSSVPTSGPTESMPARLVAPPERPYVMFASMTPGQAYGHVALAPFAAPDAARFVADLTCSRLYFAGARGICLDTEFDGLSAQHVARLFDASLRTVASLALTGVPSRARVSVDGRHGAITVFEQGHSYAEDGFATKTTIVDMSTSAAIGDLEQFTVLRNGAPFKAVDFNFWGVTFMQDGDRFYATLATGGKPYLVEGRIDTRTMRVVRDGIECPSLSPDNRRLAYKHLVDAAGFWRVHVLDLTTMQDVALEKETRSVDDQVDWLDDEHVIYHVTGSRGADVWKLRADGTGEPELLMPFAYSPSVVR